MTSILPAGLSPSSTDWGNRIPHPAAVQGRTDETDTAQISDGARKKYRAEGNGASDSPDGLSADQQKEVDKLKKLDKDVHAHEQAHMMAGGSLVRGGAKYAYKTGPDGQRYAVGGEVNIDTTPVDGDPRATIRKAEQIRKAAQAPNDPSGQDQKVASEAASMEMKAQGELMQSQGTTGGSVDKKA
jgi:hypothetical protein